MTRKLIVHNCKLVVHNFYDLLLFIFDKESCLFSSNIVRQGMSSTGLYDTVFDVDNDKARAQAQGLEPNGFSFEGTDAGCVDYALNRHVTLLQLPDFPLIILKPEMCWYILKVRGIGKICLI